MKIKTHKDLNVWKESIELTKDIYKVTQSFPKEEIYALTSQMRRAAISVASNIAEGVGRLSNKDFIRFLYIALGSLSEIETQLIIAKELHFTKNINNSTGKISSIRKMLIGLINSIK